MRAAAGVPVAPASATPLAAEADAPAVEQAEIEPRQRRYSRATWALTILAAISMVAALYLARAFFVPLLIGILASYTLRPLVDVLRRIHVPQAIGAALV